MAVVTRVEVEFGERPPNELIEAMVAGAYKPVAKKKRQVETIYPEVEKTRMVEPEDIYKDLPEVPRNPSPRSSVEGKRLTQERMQAFFKEDCAKGF